jgi:hypothetical protein
MKEYDPGWGKAIDLGTLCAGCDHERRGVESIAVS